MRLLLVFCLLSTWALAQEISIPKPKAPKGAVLAILDGCGEAAWPDGNAVGSSPTPELDKLKSKYPYFSLVAAGWPVGVRRGQMGNSIVGHQTLGLGRTEAWYPQRLEIETGPGGAFWSNPALLSALNASKQGNRRIHIVGLLGTEGIHSDQKYMYKLLELIKAHQDSTPFRVYVHPIFFNLMEGESMDGLVSQVQTWFTENGINGRVVTVHAKKYAMDREFKWDRTKKFYEAIVGGVGDSVTEANLKSRLRAIPKPSSFTPLIVTEGVTAGGLIQSNDMVVFFNYREDRMIQSVRALGIGPEAETFTSTVAYPSNIRMVPFVQYSTAYTWTPVLQPNHPVNGLGEWLSKKGFKQTRVAEMYKKRHMECYFSGGIVYEAPFTGESRNTTFPSPSDKNLRPAMNNRVVIDAAIHAIQKGTQKLVAINLASTDGAGHTGNYTAARVSMMDADKEIKRLYDVCKQEGYVLFVTADHGNSEEMSNLDGTPQKTHTLNNVPFVVCSEYYMGQYPGYGVQPSLAHVAPSILEVLQIERPPEMIAPLVQLLKIPKPFFVTGVVAFSLFVACFVLMVVFCIGCVCGCCCGCGVRKSHTHKANEVPMGDAKYSQNPMSLSMG